MTRQYTRFSPGKKIIYEGWDRDIEAQTEFVALIRDEDSIDILGLDDPDKLDGVTAFVIDEPCTKLLGVWRHYKPFSRAIVLGQLLQLEQAADTSESLSYAIERILDLPPNQFDQLVKTLQN